MHLLEGVHAYPKGRSVLLRGSSCNVYAVRQPDGSFFLIDAGVAVLGKVNRLTRALERDGFHLPDLAAIILTHAHPDHANGVPALLERAPRCEVWVHAQDRASLEDPRRFWDWGADAHALVTAVLPRGALWVVQRAASFAMGKSPSICPDRVFSEGEILGTEPAALEVVHTPGHTPGHCCFLLRQQALLVNGDLFDPAHDHRPSLVLPTADFTETRESLARVRALEAETLASGHGEGPSLVVQGRQRVHHALSRALEHLAASREGVLQLLRENRQVPFRDFHAVIPDIWPGKFERLIVAYTVLKELLGKGEVQRHHDQFALVQ